MIIKSKKALLNKSSNGHHMNRTVVILYQINNGQHKSTLEWERDCGLHYPYWNGNGTKLQGYTNELNSYLGPGLIHDHFWPAFV